MISSSHWDRVYAGKAPDAVSWYQEQPTLSLALIQRAGGSNSRVIDVGGGASVLVDHLLDLSYERPTVLDLSVEALHRAQARLGARAALVDWIADDVTTAPFRTASYDVWHDRAVFHFLTEATDRERYVRQAARALGPGGALVIATFADDGPNRCSGLPVHRYSADALVEQFAGHFQLAEHHREVHHTPSGAEQSFVYCLLSRTSERIPRGGG